MTDATDRVTAADPLQVAAAAYQAARDAENAAKRRSERAHAALLAARQETEQQRNVLAEAIAMEARKGRTNADIRKITHYTRERVRQICRAAGVEPVE